MAAAKAPFYSRYNRPETIPCETGTDYDKVRNFIIDEKGHKVLVVTGETNRYQRVQAHKEECLIENILTAAVIDPTILNKRKGQYIDTVGMPKTLAEYQNLSIKLKQEFYELPVETRAKFDNTPEKYVMTYGTKEWGEALGLVKEKVVEEKTETKEEKKEETK